MTGTHSGLPYAGEAGPWVLHHTGVRPTASSPHAAPSALTTSQAETQERLSGRRSHFGYP